MRKSIGRIAWECFVELGITVVYATIAGLLVVGAVATDDGPGSVLSSVLFAGLSPAPVVLLIGLDLVVRVAGERRALRRQPASVSAETNPAMRLSRS